MDETTKIQAIRQAITEKQKLLEWIEDAAYGGNKGIPFDRLKEVGEAADKFDTELFGFMSAQDDHDKHGRGCGGWLDWYHGSEGQTAGEEHRARRLVLIAEYCLLGDILREIDAIDPLPTTKEDIPDDEIPF